MSLGLVGRGGTTADQHDVAGRGTSGSRPFLGEPGSIDGLQQKRKI